MSSKDIESGEKKPLISKVGTKERDAIEAMEGIGSEGNANFAPAIQMSLRTAVIMCLLATIIWVPSVQKFFNAQFVGKVPLLICLFVFTVNPLMGQAINNAFCGIWGTFVGCFHMWVMNGIFPGGMKEGMSPTSSVAIFGWANFLIFTFIVLWCKCGMGTKMFALATDIGFMLAFLNPASTLPFSENFTLSSEGTAVNTMYATILGTMMAPLMNLIPYPMSFATRVMKENAVKASTDTGVLFERIIQYYAGSEASVVIEVEVKKAGDLRAELDGMGGAIGATYWECLDIGTPGTVRALMESHVGLMNNIYDRMMATLIISQGEDFGPSHTTIMGKIWDEAMAVATLTKKLLIAVTEAATDGDISSSEKATLSSLVKEVKDAVKQLAKEFDAARRELKTPISPDVLGENYFVFTISAYARLVTDYSDMMMTNPPKGAGFSAAITGAISSTWDFGAMTEKFNMSFTIVHYIALIIGWFYAVYVDNWGGGCVITMVFLMSNAVCPDIQVFLNVLNAVILSVVLGTLIYQWSCGSGFGDYLLPFLAFFLWVVGLYGYFAKTVFLLPCVVFVALTPFRWVSKCPTGEVSAGARALWGGMCANLIAILLMCGCQYLGAVDRANHLAINALDDAFGSLRKAFKTFWDEKDATEPMGPCAGSLGAGSGYCASAAIEPRFWRNDWKAGLYTSIVAHCTTIRIDVLMLWFAVSGSDGVPDKIFSKIGTTADWDAIKKDLDQTLEDAHSLAIAMLSHEEGHFTGLSALKVTTGIDTLDNLPDLIKELGEKKLSFSDTIPDTMEDDELVQISATCFLLDLTIKHIASLLKGTIRQA